ncbi:MAG: hypothetical protein ABII79_10805 [bacterium]
MKRLTATILTIMALSLLIGCSQGEKKVMLRYRYEPGTKLAYLQIAKRKSQVVQADSTIKESTGSFEVRIEQLVKQVFPDSTAEVDESATWVFEKPNKEDTTIIDTVEQNRRMVFRVSPRGKVLDIKFTGDEGYTSIQYIKNFYEQGMPVFPAREQSPGDSWTQTTRVILPGEAMEASMTYTVLSLAREAGYDCAVIESEGNMVLPIESQPQDSVQRSGLDRISSSGVFYFAYREGLVVLQRERWTIDRERTTTCTEETKEYRETVELDIEFALKERSVVDSLTH